MGAEKWEEAGWAGNLKRPAKASSNGDCVPPPFQLPALVLLFCPHFSASRIFGGVAQGFGRPLGERISWTLFETTMYTVLLVKGAATVAEGAGGLGL